MTSRMVQIQERRMVAKENPDSCCWRDVCLFLVPISHGARGLVFFFVTRCSVRGSVQNTLQSPILLTDTGESQITGNLSETSEDRKRKGIGNC